jgi:hypothetical protein
MKYVFLIPLAATFFVANSFSQERIYRCGNEYTNTVPSAQTHGCKLMQGGNVTVVQGGRPAASSTPARSSAAPSGGPRVDAGEQRSRDSDSRQILEAELKKAEARQLELLKEYNNGEPDKIGGEARNHQKYLDRIAELKASLARNESDIAGIRRELGRSSAASAAK